MTGPSDELLDFWFSGAARPYWFKPDAAFDARLAARFAELAEAARTRALDDWAATPKGALARIILLDQLPRNLRRGAAAAFEADAVALEAARDAVRRSFDAALTEEQRVFLYLPYMHAEDLAAQDEGVALYRALGRAENLDYMTRHREAIARFGRFPHRNAILGRETTPEESEFLKDPGNWF
jgi:uncharacterized protein (DUF924 family)